MAIGFQVDLDAVDSAAAHPIGTVVEGANGAKYQYIKQVGATTSAAGEVAAVASSGTWGEVSRTAATSLVNGVATCAVPAGVFQSALATNKYGWIQISGSGRTALATTDGSVAAGDALVIDGAGTPVGAVDTMAAGEEMCIFGFATTADSGTTQPAGSYILTLAK